MSLINDALRRKDDAKRNPGSTPASGAPMQPVHSAPKSDASPFGPILLIVIAIVVVLGGWFLFKGWRGQTTTVVTTPPPVETPVLETVVSQPETEVAPTPPVTNLTVTTTTEPTSVPATDSPDTNATVAAEPVPPPPPLKLQGIIFRLRNPTAMINGKSLLVGESVSGARVTKIEKDQVTLERDGKTVILNLP